MLKPARCSLAEALRCATICFQFRHNLYSVFQLQGTELILSPDVFVLLTDPVHRRRADKLSASWGQYHDHLAAFQFGFLLNFRAQLHISFYTIQHLAPQLLVSHLTAAKAQSHFYLVTVV